MASIEEQANHVEDQENDTVSLSTEEKNEEQIPINENENENEEIDMTTDGISETDHLSTISNSTNMITAEASFTEATSADIPLGATRSSVARILVKPGQVFRVQVDNEVKEVHGKTRVFLIDTVN